MSINRTQNNRSTALWMLQSMLCSYRSVLWQWECWGWRRNMPLNRYDLEERLINFAVRCISLTEHLPNKKAGNHIRGQLLRSGTSPAANYAEAQSAESQLDFIHKIKVVLKELRETRVWLLIIVKATLVSQMTLEPMIQECNELISIFVKSVQTANKRS